MDAIIANLIDIFVEGGPQTIMVLLMVIVIILLIEQRSLKIELMKRWDKRLAIAEQYYQGNITCGTAFNSLRGVLLEMGTKL